MALKLSDPAERLVIADVDLPMHEPMIGAVDPEATYTLRRLTSADHERLRQPYVKHTFNRQTHKREELPLSKEDAEAFSNALIDYVLVEWAGVVDGDTPAPCDAAHKAKLDGPRKVALVRAAMMNEVDRETARRDSFRPVADVGAVVE